MAGLHTGNLANSSSEEEAYNTAEGHNDLPVPDSFIPANIASHPSVSKNLYRVLKSASKSDVDPSRSTHIGSDGPVSCPSFAPSAPSFPVNNDVTLPSKGTTRNPEKQPLSRHEVGQCSYMVPIRPERKFSSTKDPPLFKPKGTDGRHPSYIQSGRFIEECEEQGPGYMGGEGPLYHVRSLLDDSEEDGNLSGSPHGTPGFNKSINLSDSSRNSIGSDLDFILRNSNMDLAALTVFDKPIPTRAKHSPTLSDALKSIKKKAKEACGRKKEKIKPISLFMDVEAEHIDDQYRTNGGSSNQSRALRACNPSSGLP